MEEKKKKKNKCWLYVCLCVGAKQNPKKKREGGRKSVCVLALQRNICKNQLADSELPLHTVHPDGAEWFALGDAALLLLVLLGRFIIVLNAEHLRFYTRF